MKKIELEHLELYFSTGLRCKILDYQCDYVGDEYGMITGYYWYAGEVHYAFKDRSVAGKTSKNFKPIMRQLSDIKTDEIFWNEFYNEFGGGYSNIKAFKNSWGIEILLDPMNLGYKHLKHLLKRHYDIFGLIDAGLAVDIKSIK